ncbi:DUF262 domain-containing HNH endonuclease family protein [Brevundimonas sp.]|uniref:DUF262 domain-containing protein n=1 Tax=Brevundimonas sp. TaxID=1871086 RepID=UPI002896ACE7|nr:DUF262 domain-containing HNH endonuclease family protein [Brevundimonas sp.]
MSTKKIDPQDKNLKTLFQDFYRVPDYQREYVWGETNPKGEGGEEVDQFLNDIYAEYENATAHDAPEYFIGTIVVCRAQDEVFDLIDGQQRTTTAFLTLCAIRDALNDLGAVVPDELKSQIAASDINWQGQSQDRLRLDLQYEDAGSVLEIYAAGNAAQSKRDGTRSIRNIGNAYETVREFLRTTLADDPEQIRRFYGYLTNKVKIIRIETPSLAMALKIFETINDRGVGLDAMDLLKNLLFMHAKGDQFSKLKTTWKSLTDAIYQAGEKPLRFLRYYMLATYNLDGKLREDGIYDWFQKNATATGHEREPLVFASRLLEAAKAYGNFAKGLNVNGEVEAGIGNTQLAGGKSIKQHFVLLMAGRHLPDAKFSKLANELEKTMFTWLITGTPGKEYERRIIEAAHILREIKASDIDAFESFLNKHLVAERASLSKEFDQALKNLSTRNVRGYRLRYLLAKVTQYVDLTAYGTSESRGRLADYTLGGNDIEHILADKAEPEARQEFGTQADDQEVIQSLGNLLLIEKSINRSISNGRYSGKVLAYAQSKFLLTRCQADTTNAQVGVADKITSTVQSLKCWPSWNATAVEERQAFITELAQLVFDVPAPPVRIPTESTTEGQFP